MSTRHQLRQRGFTLIELLVVMVIIGITLGLVSLNAMPNGQQALQKEAERIALLLQLARDEAIVRNRLVAFEADDMQYRFIVRNETRWDPIVDDDLLRQREFKDGPVTLLMDPNTTLPGAPLRITFGREPVDKPFMLTLVAGNARVAIRADGVGHFVVEQ